MHSIKYIESQTGLECVIAGNGDFGKLTPLALLLRKGELPEGTETPAFTLYRRYVGSTVRLRAT